MVKIRAADPSLFGPRPRTSKPRELSPMAQARQQQQQQFSRLIAKLEDESQVFEVKPDSDEKPSTIRLRLLRVAKEQNKEIAIRKHPSGDGFIVGLMTPERRSTRGRRAASSEG